MVNMRRRRIGRRLLWDRRKAWVLTARHTAAWHAVGTWFVWLQHAIRLYAAIRLRHQSAHSIRHHSGLWILWNADQGATYSAEELQWHGQYPANEAAK